MQIKISFFKALAIGAMVFTLANQAHAQARVQVIHNSGDSTVRTVDFWVNGAKVLENMEYQAGSPYLTMPSGMNLAVEVKRRGSTAASPALFSKTLNLMANANYQLVSVGVLTPGSYAPNPRGISIAFDLMLYSDAKTVSDVPGNVAVRFMHGTTDTDTLNAKLRNQIDYLFSPTIYRGTSVYRSLLPAIYNIQFFNGSGFDNLLEFQILLGDLADSSVTILSTGFQFPDTNTRGAPFGMLVVTGGGRQGVFAPVPVATKTLAQGGMMLSPNPAINGVSKLTIRNGGNYTITVGDLSGRTISQKRVIVTSALNVPVVLPKVGMYILSVSDGKNKYVSRIVY